MGVGKKGQDDEGRARRDNSQGRRGKTDTRKDTDPDAGKGGKGEKEKRVPPLSRPRGASTSWRAAVSVRVWTLGRFSASDLNIAIRFAGDEDAVKISVPASLFFLHTCRLSM